MASAGEIIRVALHYTMPNAGDVMNVFHFVLSGVVPDDDDTFDEIAEWVNNEWAAAWTELASSLAELVYFEVDIMNTDGTVARNIGTDLVGEVGIHVLDAYSPQAAAYLLAYTSVPKARGSKYVPGMAESEVGGGAFSVGALTDIAALLVVFLGVFTGSGGLVLTPGVLSRTLLAFVPFLTTGILDTVVATQRRRKAGVGI